MLDLKLTKATNIVDMESLECSSAVASEKPVTVVRSKLVPTHQATEQLLHDAGYGEAMYLADSQYLGRAVQLSEGLKIPENWLSFSSRHCRIYREPSGRWTVVDSSTNGTFINGKRIEKHAPVYIKAGDILRLSNPPAHGNADKLNTTLEFRFEQEEEEALSSHGEGAGGDNYTSPRAVLHKQGIKRKASHSHEDGSPQSTSADAAIGSSVKKQAKRSAHLNPPASIANTPAPTSGRAHTAMDATTPGQAAGSIPPTTVKAAAQQPDQQPQEPAAMTGHTAGNNNNSAPIVMGAPSKASPNKGGHAVGNVMETVGHAVPHHLPQTPNQPQQHQLPPQPSLSRQPSMHAGSEPGLGDMAPGQTAAGLAQMKAVHQANKDLRAQLVKLRSELEITRAAAAKQAQEADTALRTVHTAHKQELTQLQDKLLSAETLVAEQEAALNMHKSAAQELAEVKVKLAEEQQEAAALKREVWSLKADVSRAAAAEDTLKQQLAELTMSAQKAEAASQAFEAKLHKMRAAHAAEALSARTAVRERDTAVKERDAAVADAAAARHDRDMLAAQLAQSSSLMTQLQEARDTAQEREEQLALKLCEARAASQDAARLLAAWQAVSAQMQAAEAVMQTFVNQTMVQLCSSSDQLTQQPVDAHAMAVDPPQAPHASTSMQAADPHNNTLQPAAADGIHATSLVGTGLQFDQQTQGVHRRAGANTDTASALIPPNAVTVHSPMKTPGFVDLLDGTQLLTLDHTQLLNLKGSPAKLTQTSRSNSQQVNLNVTTAKGAVLGGSQQPQGMVCHPTTTVTPAVVFHSQQREKQQSDVDQGQQQPIARSLHQSLEHSGLDASMPDLAGQILGPIQQQLQQSLALEHQRLVDVIKGIEQRQALQDPMQQQLGHDDMATDKGDAVVAVGSNGQESIEFHTQDKAPGHDANVVAPAVVNPTDGNVLHHENHAMDTEHPHGGADAEDVGTGGSSMQKVSKAGHVDHREEAIVHASNTGIDTAVPPAVDVPLQDGQKTDGGEHNDFPAANHGEEANVLQADGQQEGADNIKVSSARLETSEGQQQQASNSKSVTPGKSKPFAKILGSLFKNTLDTCMSQECDLPSDSQAAANGNESKEEPNKDMLLGSVTIGQQEPPMIGSIPNNNPLSIGSRQQISGSYGHERVSIGGAQSQHLQDKTNLLSAHGSIDGIGSHHDGCAAKSGHNDGHQEQQQGAGVGDGANTEDAVIAKQQQGGAHAPEFKKPGSRQLSGASQNAIEESYNSGRKGGKLQGLVGALDSTQLLATLP